MDDIGRYIRLQGAIRASIDAVPEGQAPVAGMAMVNVYRRFRAEAKKVIPSDHAEEFDAMFPDDVAIQRANPRDDLLDSAARYTGARLLLATLAGWLDGFVQEAKMQIEADAYAQARVKEERGVGFHAT